jgi:hypothetical protein
VYQGDEYHTIFLHRDRVYDTTYAAHLQFLAMGQPQGLTPFGDCQL